MLIILFFNILGLRLHIKCAECSYSTWRRSHLERHIDTVHKKLKPYKCDICPFSTGRKGHLDRHVDNVHKKIKSFLCDKCSWSTGRKVKDFDLTLFKLLLLLIENKSIKLL